MNAPLEAAASPDLSSKNERIVAIDALRGFDMFWIVGGQQLVLALASAVYASVPPWIDYQLEHVEWEGFTAWDLIMPLFLFVVGASMPFSISNRLATGTSKWNLYLTMVRRSAILFVLGMIVQGHLLDFDLSTLHIYCNTLQAIAAGYVVAGIVMLNVGLIGQWIFALLMLVGYWLMMLYVPIERHAAGALLPNDNLALAIDERVLGSFRDGTTYTWVLSGMTFAATVLLGVQSGHLLRSRLTPIAKFFSLASLAFICLAGGWLWAAYLGFPIIKHIWTSSMVLWAAGWSYLLLALFYLFIDIIGWRRWAFPFIVIGMNAITVYVASFVVPFRDMAEYLVGGLSRHLDRGGAVSNRVHRVFACVVSCLPFVSAATIYSRVSTSWRYVIKPTFSRIDAPSHFEGATPALKEPLGLARGRRLVRCIAV